mmetsp:Transcript_29283/g.57492  ORF Transcript_29283/g.57492 Transcript_29283/m.57492 type:complete len:103 (-) Transcript_29283:421-729(-)
MRERERESPIGFCQHHNKQMRSKNAAAGLLTHGLSRKKSGTSYIVRCSKEREERYQSPGQADCTTTRQSSAIPSKEKEGGFGGNRERHGYGACGNVDFPTND